MRFHPASELFPMMSEHAFDELVADIKAHGQRAPIVLFEGAVLDGRNRLRACERLGVEPCVQERDDIADPVGFVLSLNLHRRHLDESQRAMVSARARQMFEADARERQRASLAHPGQQVGAAQARANLPAPRPRTRAREQAAALLSVSPRSVENASVVLNRGIPELAAAVDAGRVAVSTAAVIAREPAEEQRAVVIRGEKEIVAAAKAIRQRAHLVDPAKAIREKEAAFAYPEGELGTPEGDRARPEPEGGEWDPDEFLFDLGLHLEQCRDEFVAHNESLARLISEVRTRLIIWEKFDARTGTRDR